MQTRCNRWYLLQIYYTLNMFRAILCPSSGAPELAFYFHIKSNNDLSTERPLFPSLNAHLSISHSVSKQHFSSLIRRSIKLLGMLRWVSQCRLNCQKIAWQHWSCHLSLGHSSYWLCGTGMYRFRGQMLLVGSKVTGRTWSWNFRFSTRHSWDTLLCFICYFNPCSTQQCNITSTWTHTVLYRQCIELL